MIHLKHMQQRMLSSYSRSKVLINILLFASLSSGSIVPVDAFSVAAVVIKEHIFSDNKFTFFGEDKQHNDPTSSPVNAPYHQALEIADTFQDIGDIVSDFKTITATTKTAAATTTVARSVSASATAQSMMLIEDTILNHLLIASHVADILVDIFHRIFSKSIGCKIAHVFVKLVSLAMIYSQDPMIERPEQFLLQGLLLFAATQDLCDAKRNLFDAKRNHSFYYQ